MAGDNHNDGGGLSQFQMQALADNLERLFNSKFDELYERMERIMKSKNSRNSSSSNSIPWRNQPKAEQPISIQPKKVELVEVQQSSFGNLGSEVREKHERKEAMKEKNHERQTTSENNEEKEKSEMSENGEMSVKNEKSDQVERKLCIYATCQCKSACVGKEDLTVNQLEEFSPIKSELMPTFPSGFVSLLQEPEDVFPDEVSRTLISIVEGESKAEKPKAKHKKPQIMFKKRRRLETQKFMVGRNHVVFEPGDWVWVHFRKIRGRIFLKRERMMCTRGDQKCGPGGAT